MFFIVVTEFADFSYSSTDCADKHRISDSVHSVCSWVHGAMVKHDIDQLLMCTDRTNRETGNIF